MGFPKLRMFPIELNFSYEGAKRERMRKVKGVKDRFSTEQDNFFLFLPF